MFFKKTKFFQILTCCALSAFLCSPAKAVPLHLSEGHTLQETSLEKALSQVQPGDVVILGELHGQAEIAHAQVNLLKALRAQGLKVSVGLEFFDYPQQSAVNAWRAGTLDEKTFLEQIGWGKGNFPFAMYKEQAQFPTNDSYTLALNAPRALTSKIAKGGLGSLTAEEKALLPPNFSLGNDLYRERFAKMMGGHGGAASVVERYFSAQSVWDDTMAWRAAQFVSAYSEQVLVIVVGEFHVAYGGGLPDRLRTRGVSRVHTFSFVNLHDLTATEQAEELSPAGPYGPRADWLWTFDF